MSEALQHRAETLKLARVLGVEVEALPSLDGVPSAELAELRERVTDRLFDESTRVLSRAGAAARLVPSPLIATIAQRAFGPLLSALTAASIDPGKAVDVATRMAQDFLTDVTIELDPRRVASIIAGVPETLAVPVARELARREEWVTMGRFLAFVPDEPLAAAMAVLDDEVMLRTAFVLEHKDRLDHAVALLEPHRLAGILRCASEQDLWPEALDLLGHLSDARLRPIADTLAGLGPDVVAGLVDAVCRADLWASLLPLVRLAGAEARLAYAAAPALHSERALSGIVATAASEGLWTDLLPLLDLLPHPARSTVANLAGRLDPVDLAVVVAQALQSPATTASLVGLYLLMDDRARGAVRDAAARGRRTAELDAALEGAS